MNTLWLIVDIAGHTISRSIRRGAALVGYTWLTLAFSVLLTGMETLDFMTNILCALSAGALIGSLIAGITGVVQGMVTGLFFQNHFKPEYYHDVIQQVTAVSAVLLGVVCFIAALMRCAAAGPLNPIYVFVGAILAILTAVYGVGDVPAWYLDQKRKTADVPETAANR